MRSADLWIGIKELWEVDAGAAPAGPGRAHASAGRSTPRTYGGSFLYHLEDDQVAVGFVVGLDYKNPVSEPVRGIPALQDAPGVPPAIRGRAAHRLWRAGAERGRVPIDPAARFPGRRAGRLRRRLCQRAQDQGHPYGDEIGHGRGRGRVRAGSAASRPPSVGAALKAQLGVGRAAPGAQYPARLSLGAVGGARLCGARHLCPARRCALDVSQSPRSHAAAAGQAAPADRLSPARRQGHLRPAVLGVHLQHQS